MFYNNNLQKAYRIDNVIVNPQLNTIQRQQDIIKLEPKAMKLLEFLVNNQGKVCSKQEILDEIWPRQIVAEDAVTRLIFVLRNVLDDNAKSPRFISTIPKKGYVFLIKATSISSRNRHLLPIVIVTSLILLGAILFWYQKAVSVEKASYQIKRSIPITHQEGREYNYVQNKELTGYFHQYNNLTKLIINKEKDKPKVIANDHWHKRSLIIADNVLFYIRYLSNQFQIIQQQLDGTSKILFESKSPIYSLTIDEQAQGLLFNQYQDNENINVYRYSFINGQVKPVVFANNHKLKKIYLLHYHASLDTLFLVDVKGKKPSIYGIKQNTSSVRYHIEGFESIRHLTEGKTANDLLVLGTYQLTQGIWSVSLKTNEISLITSHPDNEITQAQFSEEQNALYYSFQGRRVDLKEVSISGLHKDLPHLNSTLVDSIASYSSDGDLIYFASDRSGDFELYSYQTETFSIDKVSNLKATKIWHYSFSNDRTKVAIVYSTDHIRLGVIALDSAKLINSVPLEEIKFPLGWSKNDKHIYVSEHLSNIAMYQYDAENLAIQNKRKHLGLTAIELNPDEIVAFDYQSKSFVAYNFHTNQQELLSDPVQNYTQLAPHNTYSDGKQAMMLYSDGMKKTVYRIQLSKSHKNRQQSMIANLLISGNIQAFSSDMSTFLVADKEKSLNGNIIALQLN